MDNTVNSQTQKTTQKNLPYITFGKVEISAVVLIILAAILAYYFGRRKYRGERHEDVYNAFHDTFIPAIKILTKETGTFKQEDFINFKNTFDSQNTIMLKMQDRLKGNRLRRFNEKWQEYKDCQKYCETYEFTVMAIGIESNRQRLLELIYEILKISKH
ncbi:MAG: hypothetical protein NTX75_13060 [Proteobacteria bacterium]|nr:hypothetical protein [Pseudomonadota bacterium]